MLIYLGCPALHRGKATGTWSVSVSGRPFREATVYDTASNRHDGRAHCVGLASKVGDQQGHALSDYLRQPVHTADPRHSEAIDSSAAPAVALVVFVVNTHRIARDHFPAKLSAVWLSDTREI